MALWIEDGGVASAGRRRSRASSTARRSSSKKAESFIGGGNRCAGASYHTSRFALPFGVKRFSRGLAIGFFQQDFHAAFRFFQLFLAFAGKSDTLLEELHGVVE